MTHAALEVLTRDSDELVMAACCGPESIRGIEPSIDPDAIPDISPPIAVVRADDV